MWSALMMWWWCDLLWWRDDDVICFDDVMMMWSALSDLLLSISGRTRKSKRRSTPCAMPSRWWRAPSPMARSLCVYIYMCMYIYINVCINTHSHTHARTRTHARTHARTHTHTHTHTHTGNCRRDGEDRTSEGWKVREKVTVSSIFQWLLSMKYGLFEWNMVSWMKYGLFVWNTVSLNEIWSLSERDAM